MRNDKDKINSLLTARGFSWTGTGGACELMAREVLEEIYIYVGDGDCGMPESYDHLMVSIDCPLDKFEGFYIEPKNQAELDNAINEAIFLVEREMEKKIKQEGLTLEQIKQAITDGKQVRWSNDGYVVYQANHGGYLMTFTPNDYTTGLTWLDGVTMNGNECDFYIVEEILTFDHLNTLEADWCDLSFDFDGRKLNRNEGWKIPVIGLVDGKKMQGVLVAKVEDSELTDSWVEQWLPLKEPRKITLDGELTEFWAEFCKAYDVPHLSADDAYMEVDVNDLEKRKAIEAFITLWEYCTGDSK